MTPETRWAAWLLLGCAGIGPACAGGARHDDQQDPTARVGIDLTTGGESINSVHMVVSGPTPIVRDINTASAHSTISAFTGALLPGAYVVTMTATALSGDSCTGGASFTVVAGVTASVTVPITCGTQVTAQQRGNATLDAPVTNAQNCPFLTSVVVAPLKTDVNGLIDVVATVNGAGVVTWTSDIDGTFDAGQYACVSAGPKLLTVSVRLPGTTCLDTLSTQVFCQGFGDVETCPSPFCPVGSGGSSGSGGSGSVDASAVCTPPQQQVDPAACQVCETAQGCDPAANCALLTSAADRDACQAVLGCARRTSCTVNSVVDCYCGLGVDVVTCKANIANATGLCKNEIIAGNPTGTSSSDIVDTLTDVTRPAGNALNLVQCDYSFCGDPALGLGNGECVPYCR
jgi:hypothetical protein